MLLCLSVAGGSRAVASGPLSAEPVVGSVDTLQGSDAVEHMEDTGTLAAVAADAGFEPGELTDELLNDPTMFVTEAGFVGYADTLEGPSVADDASRPTTEPPGDVFALESRPASGRLIYLDFDGHTTTDWAWRASAESPIVSAPSGVSDAMAYEIWQRVSEDFLPFDVNVTTTDPGVEALRKGGPDDRDYGVRVVISPTYFSTYSAGTLGVALVSSFDADVDRPAFVFANGSSSTKTIAESISHETGHTLGLRHDATTSRPGAYYDGHGDWAPIMGRPITRPVTQWSRGEYANADNTEDDLSKIAGVVGYRPDDHGDTPSRATVVAGTSTTSGFIGTTGDVDAFNVDVEAGPIVVSLRPPPGTATWSDLLAQVTVRDRLGSIVATGSPTVPTSWTASASANVPAGRYTVEVRPVGWKTPIDGFTTYGSLGAYELSVTSTPSTTPPPAGRRSTFTAVTPTRLVDTRNGIGASGRVGAGRQVIVQVAGNGVPDDATSAVFSIAAVNPSSQGYVTAYPCTGSVPDSSTLNFVAGQTVANTTIAALSSAGQLCVWTYTEADILVDVTGWLGPNGTSRLTPIGPTRVVDTRSGLGGGRLPAGGTMAVDLNGIVPAGSTAAAMNVTAVNASAASFLTVFPCGGSVPETSTVNYVAGEARPNNTIVGLTGGRVCIYSYAATDVLVDLVGAFGGSGLAYQPTAPIRVLDTRSGPPLGAGGAINYDVASAALGGVPPGAAFVNVTAADHVVPGYVTTYDCNVRRDTSTLNQRVGQVAANGAIVPLSGTTSCGWMYGGGHLIVDLNGWWVP